MLELSGTRCYCSWVKESVEFQGRGAFVGRLCRFSESRGSADVANACGSSLAALNLPEYVGATEEVAAREELT